MYKNQRDDEPPHEEYDDTPEERRCDLCEFEKDLPCIGKDCNSVNGLQGFKQKGETNA